MPPARIRRLEPGDAAQAREIMEGLPEWFTRGAAREAAGLVGEGAPGYAAVLPDGRLAGFIVLEERECCVEILWLAVRRGLRGRGIGSLLVGAAEEHAAGAGRRILSVKTYGGGDYEPYLETLRFYRRMGFKLYEVIEGYGPFGGQPAAVLLKPVGRG